MTALPAGLKVTGACVADAQAITDLANAASQAEVGFAHLNLEDVLARLRRPGTDLSRDWALIWDQKLLVGAIEVSSFPPHDRIMLEGFVHGDAMGRGIGTCLLDRGLRRSEEVSVTHGLDPNEVNLQHWAWNAPTPALALLENFGFHAQRWFHHRVLDLTPGLVLTPPATIQDIEVRAFRLGVDERATFLADNAIFEDHWGFVPAPFDEWCAQVVDRDDFDPDFMLLAWDAGQVAGILLATPGHGVHLGEGSVDVLGVARPWRRRGIAAALLRRSFQRFQATGEQRVGLYVDSENPTGAVGLYEGAGMRIGDRSFIAYTRPLSG